MDGLKHALPPDPNYGKKGECFILEGGKDMRCCWEEPDILNLEETIKWCQTCAYTVPPTNCGNVFIEEPSPRGPAPSPDNDGVLEEPKDSPPNNNNDFPNDGVIGA